ncbi:hypothetical protein [Hydrogenophaga intermedia]|uniref:hypothetical protein n=1 Tax=Hydrogenophaga intermedia TaxID=65786 RepID=UPI002043C242|nr:hypothetical protein [Hydrogenophaga intermedia]MCM3565916.1 hypothetical protein [Hydrogenophaga intermedia]
MSNVLPSGQEVLRESLVLIGGAILAALILSQLPELRAWIANNTRGTGTTTAGGCNCDQLHG